MRDSEDILVALSRVVEHLRKQKLPISVGGKETPLPWATKVADCICEYLNCDTDTLDEAFGLKPKPERPSNPERKKGIALKAMTLKNQGYTLEQIVDALEKDGIFLDKSVIGKYVKEFKSEILIEENAKEVIRDIINGK